MKLKEIKGLTGLINQIIEFVNSLKAPEKQKEALKVIQIKISEMLKKIK